MVFINCILPKRGGNQKVWFFLSVLVGLFVCFFFMVRILFPPTRPGTDLRVPLSVEFSERCTFKVKKMGKFMET